jgi:protein-S-isoprenylcysteine O-methyltransferase Ste14
MGALIFLPAWTLDYWQAWTLLAVFGASALAVTLYLMKRDPKLLERRTQGGPISEKETSQKIIQTITAIGFAATLVVSALDYRFAWSPVPDQFVSPSLFRSCWHNYCDRFCFLH